MNIEENGYPLLDNINSPADIKKLKIEELPALCKELRSFLLNSLSINPGHLGSNLGTIEMTVAMHYVFDTPNDKIVWDVGHQAYSHKILTGRKEQFSTLRKWNGLAGFPLPSESEYDTFAAGHASNSISAALGMAVAIAKKKEKRNVIAFIGDGALTGGLAFEGLNNTSSFPNNLLIVLNDNNMSIDNNVGALNKYLVDLTTSKTYNNFRYDIYRGLRKLRIIDDKNKKNFLGLNQRIKSIVSQKQLNIFDGFYIRYFGPIDGNDVLKAVEVLKDLKDLKGPKILHIVTTKGKGYKPAEKEPIIWHAPGLFDVESGERIKKEIPENKPKFTKYQDVFGLSLVELADIDDRIVGITPAMPTGSSMTFMMNKYPDRSYDVGIAEAHAVTFSSGLAREGLIPFCNIYSSFMQRAYDQLIHDVALIDSKVIFCLDRAGLVGEDGATHHGAFDISYLCSIPNMTVLAPSNEIELRNMMYSAYKNWSGPIAIRYPRGEGRLVEWRKDFEEIEFAKGQKLKDGDKVAIISLGTMRANVEDAIAMLDDSEQNRVAHYDLRFAKPLDMDMLNDIFSNYENIITIEDAALIGGIGMQIATIAMDKGLNKKIKRLGIVDKFIEQGTPREQHHYCKIDAESIKNEIIKMLS